MMERCQVGIGNSEYCHRKSGRIGSTSIPYPASLSEPDLLTKIHWDVPEI